MPSFTTDQVVAMAPDDASVKAGRGLANPGKWKSLQQSDAAAWGECQGSGKDPYRTSVDFSGPAFKCTCPSRKFPCKHGLGLMFLLAEKPGNFTASAPPDWVSERLQKRHEATERKLAKAENEKNATPEELEKKTKAKARRLASREQNVEAALDELDLWLEDMMRQGLASAREHPVRSYESVAARMVDQQAPGLARMVQGCREITGHGGDWADRLLEQLGCMRLLTSGYRNGRNLTPEILADVRSAVGWTKTEAEVLEEGERVSDVWQVLGQHVEEEQHLKVQRTWLWGVENGRRALILHFAAGQQPLDITLVVGRQFRAELAYFPSASPLRAVVSRREEEPEPMAEMKGFPAIEDVLQDAAKFWAANPWIERLPFSLRKCHAVAWEGGWWIRDASGDALPLDPAFSDPWILVALEGDRGMSLFGEWDGRCVRPASVWAEGRFVSLKARSMVA